jgi:hypothetical protein
MQLPGTKGWGTNVMSSIKGEEVATDGKPGKLPRQMFE